MKKAYIGILLGVFAGIIDVIPMIAQELPWSANIAAFLMWTITGFFISTSTLRVYPALKGLIVALLMFTASAPLIGWDDPKTLFTIILPTTIVLGLFLGWAINKFGKIYGK